MSIPDSVICAKSPENFKPDLNDSNSFILAGILTYVANHQKRVCKLIL
jgi:hypothetical protein